MFYTAPAKVSPWEYEAVLFVPQPPSEELAGALRAYERKRGAMSRIHIVQGAGVSLKNHLFSCNTWAKEGYERARWEEGDI